MPLVERVAYADFRTTVRVVGVVDDVIVFGGDGYPHVLIAVVWQFAIRMKVVLAGIVASIPP